MTDDSTTRGSARWSKDSVEHLRTVHFTLIAVCVALFLLSLARTKTEAETAHNQIRQIRDFLRTFNHSWIADDIRMRFPPNELSLLHGVNFVISTSDITIGAPIELSDNAILRVPASFESWKPDFWDDNPVDDFLKDLEPGPTTESEGRTLKQFHAVWDMLSGAYVQVPVMVSASAYVSADSGYLHSRKMPVRSEKQTPLPARSYPLKLYPYSAQVREFILQNQSLFDHEDYEIYYGGGVIFETHSSTTFGLAGPGHVWIPVRDFVKHDYDAQSALIRHTNPQWDWQHGSFDASFPQLNEITKDYQDIHLDTIERIVRSEAQRTGASFDLLGMKLSAEEALRWGIVVIMVLQLYLCLHLLELSPTMRRDDNALDVAWIGVYFSWYARIVMFFTTIILPVVVVTRLGFRGLHVSSVVSFRSSLFALALVMTGLLGVRTWFLLPRANDGEASLQVTPEPTQLDAKRQSTEQAQDTAPVGPNEQ